MLKPRAKQNWKYALIFNTIARAGGLCLCSPSLYAGGWGLGAGGLGAGGDRHKRNKYSRIYIATPARFSAIRRTIADISPAVHRE